MTSLSLVTDEHAFAYVHIISDSQPEPAASSQRGLPLIWLNPDWAFSG